jgi:hypothetical protein
MNIPNRAPWLNVAVGILTIISPFALGSASMAARWDLVVTGIIIGIVAIIELSIYARTTHMSYWPVINILAGIWLLISTTYAQGDVGLLWSNVVLGILAIVSAAIALSYEKVHSSEHIQHT